MFIGVFWIFEMVYCIPVVILEVWKNNNNKKNKQKTTSDICVSDGIVITMGDKFLSLCMRFPTDAWEFGGWLTLPSFHKQSYYTQSVTS